LGSEQIYGVVDPTLNIKPSMIHSTRASGAGGNPVDILDISAGATGVWSSYALTGANTTALSPTTGMGFVYDGISHEGRYAYLMSTFTAAAGPVGIFRIDLKTRELTAISPIPTVVGSTADVIANKMCISTLIDGTSTLSFLHCKIPQNNAGAFFEAALIK
jgi:hypothetical protein